MLYSHLTISSFERQQCGHDHAVLKDYEKICIYPEILENLK
jgi:hypothetical protein